MPYIIGGSALFAGAAAYTSTLTGGQIPSLGLNPTPFAASAFDDALDDVSGAYSGTQANGAKQSGSAGTTACTTGQGAGDAVNSVSQTIKAADLRMTKTVSNHINDIIMQGNYKGSLARPYIDSNGTNMLIDEIIGSAPPVRDATLAGGLKWVVEGTYRGSEGQWELVIDTISQTIVHFNFVTK